MEVVGILGVVHDEELRVQHHLTLETIERLIVDFDPDVICGEVLPSSFEKYKKEPANRGYWGEPHTIKDNADARMLCIVGADHNHALYEGLMPLNHIQLIYPLK